MCWENCIVGLLGTLSSSAVVHHNESGCAPVHTVYLYKVPTTYEFCSFFSFSFSFFYFSVYLGNCANLTFNSMCVVYLFLLTLLYFQFTLWLPDVLVRLLLLLLVLLEFFFSISAFSLISVCLVCKFGYASNTQNLCIHICLLYVGYVWWINVCFSLEWITHFRVFFIFISFSVFVFFYRRDLCE